MKFLSTFYNMSGRVVSDIQTRAEGKWKVKRLDENTRILQQFKIN
jgi:hypothetical protein